MKRLLAVFVLMGLLVVFAPTQASAQNMDMSWGIRSQMALQTQSDAYARSLAQWYYNYMQMLRSQGYTGPSLPTGFNANTLTQANQAANAAASAYIKSGMINSNRTSNAIADWDYRAIQGYQVYVDPNGYRYYYRP
jgi:hypothetical protein